MEYALECANCTMNFIITPTNCVVYLYVKDEPSNHIMFTCDVCNKKQKTFLSSAFIVGVCVDIGPRLELHERASQSIKAEARSRTKKQRQNLRTLNDKDWAKIARFKRTLDTLTPEQIFRELANSESDSK